MAIIKINNECYYYLMLKKSESRLKGVSFLGKTLTSISFQLFVCI